MADEILQPVLPDTPAAEAPAPAPMLTTVDPNAVYAATNIQNIDIPKTKSAMDMKLSKLEKKLAKANSMAELNQIGIMNQPKAMGVLTGEAAYREKLDTARVNAFNALYNARLLEEQRKEEKRQQFIATYGADPNQRPSGMSKREFAAAITGGKFTNLLTDDAKLKRAQLLEMQNSASKAGSGNIYNAIDAAWNSTANAPSNQRWQAAVNILQKNYDTGPGSLVDNELRRRNNLPPIEAPVKQSPVYEEAVSFYAQQAMQDGNLDNVPASYKDDVVSVLPDEAKQTILSGQGGTEWLGENSNQQQQSSGFGNFLSKFNPLNWF
jgi:hypothetical protein